MPAELLTAAQLREIPLFRDLSAEARELLRRHVSRLAFAKGERILNAGAYLDGAYYLLAGTVEARVPAAAGQAAATGVEMRVEELAISVRAGARTAIEAGSIFGEGSALSRFPIVTNFDAATDVSCLLIRTAALRLMFDAPELAAFKTAFDRDYKARMLRAQLQRCELFAGVEPSIVETLISRADLLTFKPGKPIAAEGDPCDAFYLVRGGYVQVSARSGAADVTTTYLRVGDWAGEAALLLNEPWPFSLTAVEHVELVRIAQDDLRRLLPAAAGDQRLWSSLVQRLQSRGQAIARPLANEALQFTATSGLIHGESVLLIDLSRCTRCDECVRGCADAHGGVPRFVREGAKFRNFSVPAACYHCTDPVCMIGCPTGAITRPLGTFQVAVDEATCIGCGNCVRRCPWDNILTVPFDSPAAGESIALATKCDLCVGRAAGPACVQMCPQGCAQRVNFKDQAQVDALFAGER
jgi:Fe-S-cluster-containing hydrogenase component 2/CRP-like cAMP-binding protein